MRPRSSWLPRPLGVACLAAVLLMMSDGLSVVHATIPYYPYECPIGSGGRDFDGNGLEQGTGAWSPGIRGTVSGSRPTRDLIHSGAHGGTFQRPATSLVTSATTTRFSGPPLEHGW